MKINHLGDKIDTERSISDLVSPSPTLVTMLSIPKVVHVLTCGKPCIPYHHLLIRRDLYVPRKEMYCSVSRCADFNDVKKK